MFGSLRRENAHLKRLVETRTEQRDDARKLAGIHQGNLTRMAQARAAQHDEVTRLRTEAEQLANAHAAELERLRASRDAVPSDIGNLHRELAKTRRLLAATQKQLDDATGRGDAGLLTVRPRPADKKEARA
ncbi:MAG: hypothetical protein JWO67_73 [Streptosporangiaceae bacterium]|nr:hypothetical protein [Streptosporangiaceae bacterium]